MTKQEEIREAIALEFFNLRCGECGDWGKCFNTRKFCETLYDRVDSFIFILHSQDVVIKINRELPKNPFPKEFRNKRAYGRARDWENAIDTILEAGYVAVEPLIREHPWDYIQRNAYHSESIEPDK